MRVGRASAVVASIAVLAMAGAKAATVDLAVSGRANTTLSIAADAEMVVIAWGATVEGGATDVYAAVSRDAGRTFGSPVRVNDTGGDARLSGEQPPRVAVQRDAITVVWTTKGPRGTVLKSARSTDGGKSYARSAIVPGGDAAGNRGWQALTADGHGQVTVVWLDHREMAADAAVATTHHDHSGGGKPDGVAMAQKSKLYVASLAGATAPRAITGGVCYCCKTAFATGRNGELFAAWRHVYPGNLRDIAFTASRDGGGSFSPIVRVSKDEWMLEGCPVDGPAMVVDAGNRVHIVWPTLVTDSAGGDPTIALFYASSLDGKTFTARERIPTEGTPHHPTLAIASDGSLVAAWDEVAGGKRRAAIGRAKPDASGHAGFSRTIVSGQDAALYPVVASAGGAAVMAWTNGAGAAAVIRVARMP